MPVELPEVGGDAVAVGRLEVEAQVLGQLPGDVLVPVSYVCGVTLSDGEGNRGVVVVCDEERTTMLVPERFGDRGDLEAGLGGAVGQRVVGTDAFAGDDDHVVDGGSRHLGQEFGQVGAEAEPLLAVNQRIRPRAGRDGQSVSLLDEDPVWQPGRGPLRQNDRGDAVKVGALCRWIVMGQVEHDAAEAVAQQCAQVVRGGQWLCAAHGDDPPVFCQRGMVAFSVDDEHAVVHLAELFDQQACEVRLAGAARAGQQQVDLRGRYVDRLALVIFAQGETPGAGRQCGVALHE